MVSFRPENVERQWVRLATTNPPPKFLIRSEFGGSSGTISREVSGRYPERFRGGFRWHVWNPRWDSPLGVSETVADGFRKGVVGGVWNLLGRSSESVILGGFRKASEVGEWHVNGGVSWRFRSSLMEPLGRRFESGSIPYRRVGGMIAEPRLESRLRCCRKRCRMRLAVCCRECTVRSITTLFPICPTF